MATISEVHCNRRSWDFSPHVLLNLKQIYRLKKSRGKAVILTIKKMKNILELYMTDGLYSGVYSLHFAEIV